MPPLGPSTPSSPSKSLHNHSPNPETSSPHPSSQPSCRNEQILEQRAQSQACLSSAESRQNPAKRNPFFAHSRPRYVLSPIGEVKPRNLEPSKSRTLDPEPSKSRTPEIPKIRPQNPHLPPKNNFFSNFFDFFANIQKLIYICNCFPFCQCVKTNLRENDYAWQPTPRPLRMPPSKPEAGLLGGNNGKMT